ncbi:undecaprenyl-diphosphate phosphatase [Candidatus Poribacteria bacterium]|nr:undecaprenyl-diphosphate phosphatase [Candidatus Poribacteria bacterium]
MTIFEAVVLGIVQGLTEFLPVSSSGHLVLMQHFLGLKEPQVFFDVMLHVGTLGAVIIVYYQSIWSLLRTGIAALGDTNLYRHPFRTIENSPHLKLIWFILLGCIPTGLIAILFKEQLESIFDKPMIVALMLVVTGLILQLPRLKRRHANTDSALKGWHTLLIGSIQGGAIIPGISRSGSTISLSLLLGLSPQEAAQYSFLLSIPAILGAVVLKLKDVAKIAIAPSVIVAGALASFVVGYIALRILLAMLNRGRFSMFSYYCFAVGGIVLIKLML